MYVDPALAFEYVVSANIHRRHLTAEQKDDVTAKLLKMTPEKSNRAIAKLVKRDGKTVAKVRHELEGRAEIPHVETRTDAKGRKQPARKPRRTEDDFRRDIAARKAKALPDPDLTEELNQLVEATHKFAQRAEDEEMIDEATAAMIKPKWRSTAARKKRDLIATAGPGDIPGPAVPAANPIRAAWDAATEAQRVEFSDFYGDEVKARCPPVTVKVGVPAIKEPEPATVEITVPDKTPTPTPENAAADPADDGLRHPMFDCRGTKS